MQATVKRENLTIVQALRGIAAVWVVLFHANEGHHIPVLRQALPDPVGQLIFDAGHFGVAIFFALSGFVISYGLERSQATLGFFGRFIVRRSIRLDPPYWASIAFSILLIVVSGAVKREHIELPTLSSLLSHLLYLQVILDYREINSVYWTLTYEIQFYLFLVGALTVRYYIRKHFDTGIHAAIDIILFLCALASSLGYFDRIHSGIFLPLWASFYIGVLAHSATLTDRAKFLFATLFVALLFHGSFSIVSALTAALLLVAMLTGWARIGMNWRWLQFLGGISYSLYLVHNPITGAIGFIVNRAHLPGIAGDLTKLAAIVLCSVVGAYIFWLIIEKRTHDIARSVRTAGPLMPWRTGKMRRD